MKTNHDKVEFGWYGGKEYCTKHAEKGGFLNELEIVPQSEAGAASGCDSCMDEDYRN